MAQTPPINLYNGSPQLAALTFSTGSGGGYTLAQGGGTGGLNLSNGDNAAVVTVSSGTHSITAPITLTSSVSITPASGTGVDHLRQHRRDQR